MHLHWLISLLSFYFNLCFIWAFWLQSWRGLFLFSRFPVGISQQSSMGSVCATWEFVSGIINVVELHLACRSLQEELLLSWVMG